MGAVIVHGNFIGSTLEAGVGAGVDGVWGTADDVASTTSKITSVQIDDPSAAGHPATLGGFALPNAIEAHTIGGGAAGTISVSWGSNTGGTAITADSYVDANDNAGIDVGDVRVRSF
jgi:hypothetical protein